MNICERCGHAGHGSVVALGRFRPDGATGYRAWHGLAPGPIRATRDEAEDDLCRMQGSRA